jgi:hypothetical protein
MGSLFFEYDQLMIFSIVTFIRQPVFRGTYYLSETILMF